MPIFYNEAFRVSNRKARLAVITHSDFVATFAESCYITRILVFSLCIDISEFKLFGITVSRKMSVLCIASTQ